MLFGKIPTSKKIRCIFSVASTSPTAQLEVAYNTSSRGYPSPSDITLGSDPALTKEKYEIA
jgi:hypothetical protein